MIAADEEEGAEAETLLLNKFRARVNETTKEFIYIVSSCHCVVEVLLSTANHPHRI